MVRGATPRIKLYLSGSARKHADLVVCGDFIRHDYAVYAQAKGNGGQVAVATVSRKADDRLCDWVHGAMLDGHAYILRVMPGSDAAFMVAVAELVDEMFRPK